MKRRGAKLGQHFLTANWAATTLADAAHAKQNTTILEIGPGKGALTKHLLATGATVVAIEKDTALIPTLHETFAEHIASGQLRVVAGDIRTVDRAALHLPREYTVGANIPYYITGEIIRMFLTATHQPTTMALLIQKEVAERIVARNGKESLLSLSVKAYGEPRYVRTVGRKNFNPPPAVDSAILAIDNISRDFFTDVSEEHFFALLHAGFASKRKQLAGNLRTAKYAPEKIAQAFTACGVEEKVRAEDLALIQWKCLVKYLLG